mmetsp:Transcript_66259/g.117663  ORF Transcript_66259/g.117663 Transcript_66259/m.117663 type:complete len:101 (+) Transcript_66259:45-347(+)
MGGGGQKKSSQTPQRCATPRMHASTVSRGDGPRDVLASKEFAYSMPKDRLNGTSMVPSPANGTLQLQGHTPWLIAQGLDKATRKTTVSFLFDVVVSDDVP